MGGDKLLTTHQLAMWLRVTPDTVLAWTRAGRIPSIRLTPHTLRFDREAVRAALSAAAEGAARD